MQRNLSKQTENGTSYPNLKKRRRFYTPKLTHHEHTHNGALSKFYERLISDQLSEHFNKIFHNSNHTASFCGRLEALDKDMYVGAVLMDL